MNQDRKLFLLDAYALIFRAYYAFISNPMSNSAGMNTSTVFGFLLALDEILRKEEPTHIAVVFDPSGPTFRNELFEDYKATRDATPEDIKISIPFIKRLVEGFNIPILEVQNYEADDVIGTLAKKAEKQGFSVFMMTPDKDFAQLVSDNIVMYKPGRAGKPAEIIGMDEVREKFLVEQPEQVIDILALWGDSSDNIPGAPGIGEKTAKQLIGKYGSVEGLYDHIEELKGKQKENLINYKDQVFLSKTLARISLDVPVDLKPDELKRKALNKDELLKLFSELEFRNITQRILGDETEIKSVGQPGQIGLFDSGEAGAKKPLGEFENIDTAEHTYHLIQTPGEVQKLADRLKEQKSFCFDTETTGLDVLDAELVGIAFCWKAREAYYIALPESREQLLQWLKPLIPLLEDPAIGKTGQNLKYDLHILKNYNIGVKGPLFDTMVAHYILKPEHKHNLNLLAEQYLGYSMVKIEELIGKKGTEQANFRSVPAEKAKEYAGEDADMTFRLAEIFRKKLSEEGFDKLADIIEMPLVTVLMDMEHEGVKLDLEALKSISEDLNRQIVEVEKHIYRLAGMNFNISSPRQLGEILFERLKIDADPRKTKTKQYSTSEDVLSQMEDRHEIVPAVLEYRSLRKLVSTYVDALPKLVHKKSGKIHTSFNQALVATGRLSSNNPNLQNIPIREERGREIRKAFIPSEPSHIFLSADYSQIELRLMAHLSDDRNMIEAFIDEEDIHTATAAKIHGISPEEVTRELRSQAKTANFGIIYGISAFGLSQRMKLSRTEAKNLIDEYFNTYPGVRKFMDESIRFAREKGYVETLFGRRRYLPDILSRNSVVRGNAERNAINTPIQGSAADIIKIAMVHIFREFSRNNLKSKMILQVHDELNFDVRPEELEQVRAIIRDQMENAVKLKVPLIIEMGSGRNWLEAH
ncbi:MAG: DNA polymerase I [Bacteroidales bacterium]|nr:DNA polymerase I [Bacteroidales bacterium]MBN2699194.1 DNA polymerase I [Bacteroidales bacterium]